MERVMHRGNTIRWLVAALLLAMPCGPVFADGPRFPARASTAVPLDHWAYPALDRLRGGGLAPSGLAALRPWTRMEFARLVEEARDEVQRRIREDNRRALDDLAAGLLQSLEREFAAELEILGGGLSRLLRVESVYGRVTAIGGEPLTDGYHFGQTLRDDFGRPFRRGTNAVAGGAWRAAAGPFAIYVRAEAQHAPADGPLSNAVLDVIALRDQRPRPAQQPFAAVNRGRLLDAYAAINFRNWQLQFGKQAIEWGSGASPSSGLLFGHNAEPLYMLRLTRVLPHRLPGPLLRWLGPVRSEFFISRLQGHQLFAGPLIYGQRVAAKPGRNLEIAYGMTTTLGGGDRPVPFRDFLRSIFSIIDASQTSTRFRIGDARTSFDFNWQIPGVRDWLTFYGELYADDDEAGFMNPPKALYKSGLRLARVPGLPQMDFTMEAVNSESPGRPDHHGSLNYWNLEFPEGYTNHGFLLGNAVGRQGRVIQLWSNYWFSAEHSLQFSYKYQRVHADFIPGGGSWDDFAVRHEKRTRNGVYFKSSLQVEHIRRYPLLFAGRTNNVALSFEVGVLPEKWPW
jgi:hypothetical protein